MTDQPKPPETTPGTPPPGGDTGGTPPAPSAGKTVAELEAQYKGLQSSYQKMKETSDAKVADATSKLEKALADIEELKQSTTSKDSQMATLVKGADALKLQLETLKSEKSTVEEQYNRSKLVMAEFPELSAFEAQGLLPKGKDEAETKQLLAKFHETLTGKIGEGVKTTMSGATPPGSGKTNLSTPPGTPGDENKEFVWGKLMETAGKDEKAFKEWEAKYDAILAKEAQSKT